MLIFELTLWTSLKIRGVGLTPQPPLYKNREGEMDSPMVIFYSRERRCKISVDLLSAKRSLREWRRSPPFGKREVEKRVRLSTGGLDKR